MEVLKRIKEEALKRAQDSERMADIIHEYNHCVLCGGELLFTHVTNFIQQAVTEEACCDCCRIRHKKETHHLQ